MSRPRILIAMHYMALGGAEAALLGLLQAHDPEQADIDLFIYDHRGELMQYVPETVRMLPEIQAYSMLERPIVEVVRKGFLGIAIGRLLARRIAGRDAKRYNVDHREDISVYHYIAECVGRFLPRISPEGEYDLAISFLLPHQYVLRGVRAKKKMAWLHTDYSTVYVSPRELDVWSGYDYIASISEEVGKGFVGVFPSLSEKIRPIENILSSSFIRRRADAPSDVNREMPRREGGLRLLTIGRYSYQKKLEEIPRICRLVREHVDVVWYIIGYGAEEMERMVRENIEAEGVQDYVVLLGKRANPYPYIKACDVYVQPSRYEGKSITVREAQILGKPVVVTDYPTASSQISDGLDGVIVPMEVEACARGMVDFLKSPARQEAVARYVQTHDFGNEHEIEKIYALAR